jgi:hypothetical protein
MHTAATLEWMATLELASPENSKHNKQPYNICVYNGTAALQQKFNSNSNITIYNKSINNYSIVATEQINIK